MPTLNIERVSHTFERANPFTIVLDGNVIGEIGDGSRMTLEVTAGRHSLSLRVAHVSSDEATFEVHEGDSIRFICSTGISGAKFALLPVLGYLNGGLIRLENTGQHNVTYHRLSRRINVKRIVGTFFDRRLVVLYIVVTAVGIVAILVN